MSEAGVQLIRIYLLEHVLYDNMCPCVDRSTTISRHILPLLCFRFCFVLLSGGQ